MGGKGGWLVDGKATRGTNGPLPLAMEWMGGE